MSTLHVEARGRIPATPAQVYALLADYHQGHPSILPKPYFTRLTVEAGGQGAGTVFSFDMEVMGTKQSGRMTVSEPDPGRVLQEEDPQAGTVTQFIFDAAEGGQACDLSIASNFTLPPGIAGLMARLFNPGIIRRIYNAELALIAAHFGGA